MAFWVGYAYAVTCNAFDRLLWVQRSLSSVVSKTYLSGDDANQSE